MVKKADVILLCELSYWLTIYGYHTEALQLCQMVHVEIPSKIDYNIWGFILFIWGLEAYIYQEKGSEVEKERIIGQMKQVWSKPRSAD